MRAFVLCCAALIATSMPRVHAQGEGPAPLSLLDVPFISQSEALCGGAAAAMVLRYWGEREITAETFAHLVDRSAAGIRTDVLTRELERRGWTAKAIAGSETMLRAELTRGRPVLALIEDRQDAFHYVVLLGWHERGVILHDPARGPFVVMSTSAFQDRWAAARHWMAVIVPSAPRDATAAPTAGPAPNPKAGACEATVAEGIRLARANDVAGAERILATAVGCPAAARELAGIRVTQKRWGEAEDLAASAIAAGDADAYAWKVLATSRFVQNDRAGALDAWNEVGEPRIDLVRIDGLIRTRHPLIERMIGARPGDLLTAEAFKRAGRRLAELPAAAATRVDYVPVSGGLAELRAVVSERPVIPRGRLELTAMAAIAAVSREITMSSASITGGGERMWGAWRFWPQRMRIAGGVEAPAPWGGVWAVDAFSERQPFTDPLMATAERVSAQIRLVDWMTSRVRWDASAGLDEWNDGGARPKLTGGARWTPAAERVDMFATTRVWPGRSAFATASLSARYRSSASRRGMVWTMSGHAEAATIRTPLDLWSAGDTGHARNTLLRAHPLLDEGRLRHERLGRYFAQGSGELQYWRTMRGPFAPGLAIFADLARTSRRLSGPPRTDIDLGLGARLAVVGLPGTFRIDVARGLHDAAHAVSIAYEN